MEKQEEVQQLEPALPILAEEGASGFPEEPGRIGPNRRPCCSPARPQDISIKTDLCIESEDAECFFAKIHYRRFRGTSGQGAGKEGGKGGE